MEEFIVPAFAGDVPSRLFKTTRVMYKFMRPQRWKNKMETPLNWNSHIVATG